MMSAEMLTANLWKTKWIQKRNQKDRVLEPESWLNNRKA